MAYLDRENDAEYEAKELRARPLTKGQHDQALGYFNTISGEPQPNGVNPLAYTLGVRQAQQELEHVENSHVESVNPSISPEDSIILEVQRRILGNLDLAYEAEQDVAAIAHKNLIWSTGTVRTYFPAKGYGFIRPDCGGLDVWFHNQDRVNPECRPEVGDKLVYLTRLGFKGGLVARHWDKQRDNGDSLTGDIVPYSAVPDLGEDIKRSMYDVMYGKRS